MQWTLRGTMEFNAPSANIDRLSHVAGHVILFLAIGSIAGCKFEPQIPTLTFPTAPPQPFGGFAPAEAEATEPSEDRVVALIDQLFDPYNLPGDVPYDGSVYEQMDQVLSGAYAYYGYDVVELARNRQDNPLSEQMFFDYLVKTGRIYVSDRATGEEFSAYEWLQRRLGMGAAGVHSLVFREIRGIDRNNPMNYEGNYLAALYGAYPDRVVIAQLRFRRKLVEFFEEDAAAIYEYLSKLDLTEPG